MENIKNILIESDGNVTYGENLILCNEEGFNMNYTGKIKPDTIARTIFLALAVINQILAVLGKGSIPIYNNEFVQVLTLLVTLISSALAWWKNNSFTSAALQADAAKMEIETFENENRED